MEGQQQRNITISLGDATKVVGLTLSATEDNWNSLQKKVCEAFGINEGQAGLSIKYTDEEGDLVSLDSDSELRQALQSTFDSKAPQFIVTLVPTSIKDQQKRLSREDRLKRKEERVKARQERLERKKLRLAMKQEWKLRQEEDPTATVLNDNELAVKKERLAKKQAKLARREERLKMKAERVARRQQRSGDIVIDEESSKMRAEDREMRRQQKLLKKQQRLERKQEKLARREERLKRKAAAGMPLDGQGGAVKPSAAEERMHPRQEQKRMRCEAREARRGGRRERPNDGLTFYSLEENKTWPADGAQLYLDGNNMMYLTSTLRSLTLNRASGKAEALLESVADALVAKMGDRIKQTVLIFDHTRTDKITTFDNGTTFRVCSARPKYPTSDDALIDWAKLAQAEKGAEAGIRMVFVTSDRALSVQLQQAGGILIKPKQFLYFACQTVTGGSDVDAWLDSLIHA